MKILNASQIKAADQATINTKRITSLELMEYAANKCVNWILKTYQLDQSFSIYCGQGNNGGDGLVIARLLHKKGAKNLKVFIVKTKEKGSEDFEKSLIKLKSSTVNITFITSNSDDYIPIKNSVVIDALFGIGLARAIEGLFKAVVLAINHASNKVLSIDMPSGLLADRYLDQDNAIIQANTTLTFQAPKLSLLLAENDAYVGHWVVLDIGLDQQFIAAQHADYHTFNLSQARSIYKKRPKHGHKGTFGHSLIIGGSYGKIGASVLATKSSLMIGSGLATAYIPSCGYTIMQTAVPEAMALTENGNHLSNFTFNLKPNAIGIGIGLGTHPDTNFGLLEFIKSNQIPTVLDADAINILAKHPDCLTHLNKKTILTPHPKELSRLIGSWQHSFELLDKVKQFTTTYPVVLVVKGHHTIVAQHGKITFNCSGNNALATAGSGDVLTGYITGLLAQGYNSLNAAQLGVYLHGLSADLAIELGCSEETFIASDNFKYLSSAFKQVK